MKARLAAITLSLIAVTATCQAAPATFPTIDAYISSLPSGPSLQGSPAEGDLNGDGFPDAAIIVGDTDSPQSSRLVILLGQPHGGFLPGPQSQGGAFSMVETVLKIEKGSLFVSMDTKGAWVRYQFKWKGAAYRLIGLQDHFANIDEDDTGFVKDLDFNLATGHYVFKKELWLPQERRKKSRIEAVAVGTVCTLEQFNGDFDFCLDQWRDGAGKSMAMMMSH